MQLLTHQSILPARWSDGIATIGTFVGVVDMLLV
jgi:hypothetical protein